MTQVLVITGEMPINEVIQRYPGTVRVFHEFGLDACCGGQKTVREAASRHGLPVETVLDALQRHLRAAERDGE